MKIFTPLKFLAKIIAPLNFFAENFAPLKNHSNRVSGLKKDPPLTQFSEILNGLTPQYPLNPIPMPRRHLYGHHSTNDIYKFSYRNDRFLIFILS